MNKLRLWLAFVGLKRALVCYSQVSASLEEALGMADGLLESVTK